MMAMLDAVHTPPSASLAAMLSYAAADGQCSLYPLLLGAEKSVESHSSAGEEILLSDKENSPSQALRYLDHTKIAAMNLVQVSSARAHMSFTPQRMKPPPRAWERRPATPFVPRNEGQKIWKRIPLQELGVDINQQPLKYEKEEKDSYLRTTKKLRLNGISFGEDREKADVVSAAVSTKWEEDNIESPKKKATRQQHIAEPLSEQACDGFVSATVCSSIVLDEDKETTQPSPDVSNENESSGNHATILSTLEIGALVSQAADHAEATSRSERVLVKEADASGQEDAQVTDNIDHPQCPHTFDNEPGAIAIDIMREVTDGVGEDTMSLLAQSSQPFATSTITLPLGEMEVSGSDEVLCSDVNLDEPEVGPHGPDTDLELFTGNSLFTEAVPSSTTSQFKFPFLLSDHDETAFLRDFLQRTQASKAAKFPLSPLKQPTVMLDINAAHQQVVSQTIATENMEPVNDLEDDDLSPPLETAYLEQAFSDIDNKASSPTRRSARTAARIANSRLPRYQTASIPHIAPIVPLQHSITPLPGTIQLKRATGNEFIFNAKRQQTLVMMTKSNTKRNQGDAVNVAQRLLQLQKELEVRQQEEFAAEAAALQATGLTIEVAVKTEEHTGTTNRKRKRDKLDSSKPLKSRRTVRWPSDELLATYKESNLIFADMELVEPTDKTIAPLTDAQEHVETADSTEVPNEGEQITVVVHKQGTQSKREDSSEDQSKLKVRRIRKIKLDSVNGTPAPKTRSRSIPGLDTLEQNASNATSTSTATTRRSSRMPVPVSTPVPLPALAGAKSKIRTTERTKELEKEIDRARMVSSTVQHTSDISAAMADSDSRKADNAPRRLRQRS